MSPIQRKLLRALSLVLFVLLAPPVILYALGYRVVSPTVAPSPVGVILIDSVPRGAKVFVDDEFIGRSPESVAIHEQRSATVRVEHEDMITWQKTLEVTPGETAEVRDIRLFPQERAVATIAEASRFSLAPDRTKLVLFSAPGVIQIVDTAGQALSPAWPFAQAPVSMLWSPNSTHVLLADPDGNFYVTNETRTRLVHIASLQGAVNVVWDPRLPSRLLYLTDTGQLFAHNITANVNGLLAENVDAFAPSGRRIIIATRSGTLEDRTFSGAISGTVTLPPGVRAAELLVTPRGSLALRDQQDVLWVRHDDEYQRVAGSVRAAGWSPDGTHLYFQTGGHSISVINVDADRSHLRPGERALVQRLTGSVQDIQWFAGGRHLLMQVDDTIVLTEIDSRDHPISHQLAETNLGHAQAAVADDGEGIFYLRRDTNTALVFQHLARE